MSTPVRHRRTWLALRPPAGLEWPVGGGHRRVERGRRGDVSMSIVFALLGAFSQALTSVLQRLANIAGSDQKRSMWATTVFLVRQPMWLLGMVCMGGTFVFTALALYFGDLGHRPAHSGHRAHLHPGPAHPVAARSHRLAYLGCGRPALCRAHRLSGCGSTTRGARPSHPDRLGGGRREPNGGDRGADHRQPVGLAGPAGGPAGCGRRPGVGHRRRLRQGGHRRPGPLRLAGHVPPLVGVRGGGQRRDRHHPSASRPSPWGRWPPPSRPC